MKKKNLYYNAGTITEMNPVATFHTKIIITWISQ